MIALLYAGAGILWTLAIVALAIWGVFLLGKRFARWIVTGE